MNMEEINKFAEILSELAQDKRGTIYIENKVNNREETVHQTEVTTTMFDINNLIESNSPKFKEETRVIETVVIEDGWQISKIPLTQLHNLSKKTQLFKAENDVYFTPNIFSWKQRKGANLWYFTCLFADLDGVSVEEAEERLKQSDLPQPSLKIFSGHGVHFYWKLSQTATKGSWDKTWLKAQNYISTQLKSDKAVNDLARLMRVPLSFNNKEDRVKTEILYKDFSNEINLLDFYNQHLKSNNKKATNKVVDTKKAITEGTKKATETTVKTKRINNYARYIKTDIHKLIEGRNNSYFDWEGMRNTTLVVLKAMHFTDNYILELNSNVFNLSESEVNNILSWENEGKAMKRKSIYDKLAVTEDEVESYNLKVLIKESDAIFNKLLAELDNKLSKTLQKSRKYFRLNYVKSSTKKQKDIAKDLNISVREVKRLKTQENIDKQEALNTLLEVADTSLSLSTFIVEDDYKVTEEQKKRLENIKQTLKKLDELLKDNKEIDAKNRFKVSVIKKKYNELEKLTMVA